MAGEAEQEEKKGAKAEVDLAVAGSGVEDSAEEAEGALAVAGALEGGRGRR